MSKLFLTFFGGRKNSVWIGYAFIAIALLILPFLVEASMGRTWVRILDFALIYAMLALGLNIVVGFCWAIRSWIYSFHAVGAYTWALLASPQFGLHLPFLGNYSDWFYRGGYFRGLARRPDFKAPW